MSDDIRSYINAAGVGAFDLDGHDLVVEIDKFQGDYTFDGPRGKETKPALWFVGKKRPLILSANCNMRSIARLYGMDVAGWRGKRITLYPEPGVYFGKPGEAVRVRPTVPQTPSAPPATSAGASTGAHSAKREEMIYSRWEQWMAEGRGIDETYETWVRRILGYDDAAPLDVGDMSDDDVDKLELVLTENEA